MYVKKLRLESFRNLEDITIYPSTGMNVIYGSNAQGKTNLLEALWIFTGGHSFRGARDTELIRIGASAFQLSMDFFSRERDQTAKLDFNEGKRSTNINGVKKNTGSALIGVVCAVIFSPEHLSLIKGGPSKRRNFIDGALCQMRPAYAKVLSSYNRSLLQRNALLKEISQNSALKEMLEIWNYRMAKYGAEIMKERERYARFLNSYGGGVYKGISQEREEIIFSYAPSVKCSLNENNRNDLEKMIYQEMLQMESRDIRMGYTSSGPHRDDLDIFIDGMSSRIYASQGQQRSAVLAMKLTEAQILSETLNESPLILLDDVMSELDTSRQDYLLNQLEGKQVFITCCSPETIDLMEKGKKFYVEKGKVEER